MVDRNKSSMKWDEARAVLDVGPAATPEDVRAAYLAHVRQHPPDREPELFERIRDAYAILRDPKSKVQQIFEGPEPDGPLSEVIGPVRVKRRFVGVPAWM